MSSGLLYRCLRIDWRPRLSAAMSLSNIHNSESDQSQRYAAAESLLQHSRLPRTDSQNINGFVMPDAQNAFQSFQPPMQSHLPPISVPAYPEFKPSFLNEIQDQMHTFTSSIDAKISSSQEKLESPGQQVLDSFSEHGQISVLPTNKENSRKLYSLGRRRRGVNRTSRSDESDPISPTSSRGFTARNSNGEAMDGLETNQDDDVACLDDKDDMDQPPAWSELKTKAGKERKRLPLACIACRRKKIRCSGEKPACKHCLRSRIPCVYKVTARKAAPRTDYMAMLDKRLKRMEERVIKTIPKEELATTLGPGRANVRPPATGEGKAHGGKKRAVGDAFEPDLDDWAESKAGSLPQTGLDSNESKVMTEGSKNLPAREIQEHLAEVFFSCLYGQSYHLLHKPSFMKRLRAGVVPPVLILAVCAISARFSTHPQINSEPEFLRGEEWAAPARDIALKHYDEPSITILTVLLILGLHEFGTCQGGRSWMLGGMAMRMAYALQLHRELDHDPLGQNDKGSELSFTDREIRRRTMWACFLMDRFNSSGTERPTCANEETIKVQLPIKESYFQMEIPGPTEDLDGYVQNSVASDTGQISNPKDNMGVASYIIRIIALWGRVIKYVNLGGRESDKCAIWKSQSEFAQLKKQAEGFQTQLPSTLQNTQDNLRTHAAEKLANQFLLMHIASYQVILFLHRFAVPSIQASKNMNDMPETFVAEAGRSAMDAANQISELLTDAIEYSVFAPFAGYCAFMSSTIQVWGIFSTNSALAIASKKNLVRNIQYLGKMKKYWGMFHFMKQNLKDIYLQHREAFTKGSNPSETITGVFQYGDWFQKYPHGVSKSEYESPAKEIKEEPGGETSANKNLDPQRVEEELLKHFPPPSLPASSRKSVKRQNKKPLQASPSYGSKLDSQAPLNSQLPPIQQPIIPIQLSNPHPAISPPPFSPHHTQTFFPSNQAPVVFPPTYDILPQLDRRLVYGAYAGSDPTASSSTTAFNALTAHNNLHVQNPSDIRTNPNLWDPTAAMTNPAGYQQQQVALDEVSQSAGYMGMSDMQTSAWFMPFNLNPPEIGLDGDEFGNVTFGPFGMGDGMGGS